MKIKFILNELNNKKVETFKIVPYLYLNIITY